jgi:hypothetical protein
MSFQTGSGWPLRRWSGPVRRWRWWQQPVQLVPEPELPVSAPQVEPQQQPAALALREPALALALALRVLLALLRPGRAPPGLVSVLLQLALGWRQRALALVLVLVQPRLAQELLVQPRPGPVLERPATDGR